MRAYFVVNSQAKLTAHAAELTTADYIVCTGAMSSSVIRSFVGGGPRLYLYTNPCYAQGKDWPNPYWQDVWNTTRGFAYNPWIFDAPYQHPIIRPSFRAADEFAHMAIRQADSGGWDGIYFDQSFAWKPPRFVLWEHPHYITNRTQEWAERQVRSRWRSYLQTIHEEASAEAPIITNCAGDPIIVCRGGDRIACAEVGPEDEPLVVAGDLIADCGHGLLWFGGLESDRIIRGFLLPEPSGAAPDADPIAPATDA